MVAHSADGPGCSGTAAMWSDRFAIAMYLIKDLTQSSLPEIGRMFGGKHHTTVLHSVQKIDKLRQKDPDLNRLIHKVTDSIN